MSQTLQTKNCSLIEWIEQPNHTDTELQLFLLHGRGGNEGLRFSCLPPINKPAMSMPQRVLAQLQSEADKLGLSLAARIKIFYALIGVIQKAQLTGMVEALQHNQRAAEWREFATKYQTASKNSDTLTEFTNGLVACGDEGADCFRFIKDNSEFIVKNFTLLTQLPSEIAGIHVLSSSSSNIAVQVTQKIIRAWRFVASDGSSRNSLDDGAWVSFLMVGRVAFDQPDSVKQCLSSASLGLLKSISGNRPTHFGTEQLHDLIEIMAMTQVGSEQLNLWLSLLSVRKPEESEERVSDQSKLLGLLSRISIAERIKLATLGLSKLNEDQAAAIKEAINQFCTWADEASDANQASARAILVNLILASAVNATSNSVPMHLNLANLGAITEVVQLWNERKLALEAIS